MFSWPIGWLYCANYCSTGISKDNLVLHRINDAPHLLGDANYRLPQLLTVS